MSKRALKQVTQSIHTFSTEVKDSMSFRHRQGMTERLKVSFKDLHALGKQVKNIRNLKDVHVKALVQHWQEKKLSTGTIKNRMSDFRYVCKYYKRANVMNPSNHHYGIEKRNFIPTENKAITNADFSNIDDKLLRASLELQKHFGLRREECLKIKPHQAFTKCENGKNYLKLQASWTKGGIERTIPIRNNNQMEAINNAIALVKKNDSMIPNNKSYLEQRNHYEKITRSNGFKNLHGLRHAYAQKRYKEITNELTNGKGWDSPIAGGIKKSALSPNQSKIDAIARDCITNDLGHSRVSIIKNYCGK